MIKNLIEKLDQNDTTPYGGNGLLLMIFVLLFIIPIFPNELHKITYNIVFSAIFIGALFSLESGQARFILYVLIALITEWIAYFFDIDVVHFISKAVNFFFFAYVVFRLILQIAKSKEVNSEVIVESINGYLLLGITYAMIIATLHTFNPATYSFDFIPIIDDNITDFGDYLYYTFVTYTTLGYGEIVPKLPYAKGLVILITISGQLYLTILIAMLVGKFLSNNQKDN